MSFRNQSSVFQRYLQSLRFVLGNMDLHDISICRTLHRHMRMTGREYSKNKKSKIHPEQRRRHDIVRLMEHDLPL